MKASLWDATVRTLAAEADSGLDRLSPQGAGERFNRHSRSLYRRHRPRTFADIVGQEPVVRTLRNAVERGKVHHAYLFVGSRGTGKTSTAKILASCLNCENGPTVEPCGQCDSCRAIAAATSLDVIEMDAASNNSVDDIRELRESVAFAPVPAAQGVHPRRGPHALPGGVERLPEDARGAAADTVFVLATTEAQQGSGDGRRPLPPLRLPPPHGRADRGRGAPRAQAEQIEIPPEAAPRSRARPPAASATRWARSSSCSPTAERRSRWRTCWRCSG